VAVAFWICKTRFWVDMKKRYNTVTRYQAAAMVLKELTKAENKEVLALMADNRYVREGGKHRLSQARVALDYAIEVAEILGFVSVDGAMIAPLK